MAINFICFSDLHLGEPEGLLYHKDNLNIIDLTIDKIAEFVSSSNKPFIIKQLILNGDIVDIALSKTEEYEENAYLFFSKLFGRINVEQIIFIPGNHDHHIWVEAVEHYYKKNYNDSKKCSIINDKDEILRQYFIPENYKGKITIAYPHYLYEDKSNITLFHHGHFVSPSLLNLLVFGKINSISKLEEKLWKIIELIWWKSKKFEPLPEILWEKLNIFLHSLGRKSYRGTTFFEDAIPIYNDKLIKNIISYITKIKEINKKKFPLNFHFIFGHTHFGGKILKEDRFCRVAGKFISIWNTGCWLVPYEKWSPDAIIICYQLNKGFSFHKLVAKSKNEEGDYDRHILNHRTKFIGK